MEAPSKVLLNPSDPEATFRSKAGKKHLGYVGNVVETVGENCSVITDYAYEQNTYSDSQFLKDYLLNQPMDKIGSVMVADGGYCGEENSQIASDHQIRLITTNFTGRKPDDIFAEFRFSEDKKSLVECIHHIKPTYTHYDERNERSIAHFQKCECENCPYQKQCKPRFTKYYAFKEISYKTVNRARQLRFMETREFKKFSHFRNGVEAIPSLMRRKYHVDTIPTHGKKQTRLYFGFKVAALNFQKLLNYNNSLEKCTSKKRSA